MKRAAILMAVLAAFGVVLFRGSKSRTFQFFGGLTSRAETREKVVALTFYDAPAPETAALPLIIKDLRAKGCTFVTVTELLARH